MVVGPTKCMKIALDPGGICDACGVCISCSRTVRSIFIEKIDFPCCVKMFQAVQLLSSPYDIRCFSFCMCSIL